VKIFDFHSSNSPTKKKRENRMAIYSLSHSSISANDAPGLTAARLIYACCRQEAVVIGERHELNRFTRSNLKNFASLREKQAGKNGRILDGFIAALPQEGSREDHIKIVQRFAEQLTKHRAPWIAAFHYDHKRGDSEGFIRNPHVHIYLFEEKLSSKPRGRGRPKKVIQLSKSGALENARKLWAETHNQSMNGKCSTIDHRSYARQGRNQLPTVHEGPELSSGRSLPLTREPARYQHKLNQLIEKHNQQMMGEHHERDFRPVAENARPERSDPRSHEAGFESDFKNQREAAEHKRTSLCQFARDSEGTSESSEFTKPQPQQSNEGATKQGLHSGQNSSNFQRGYFWSLGRYERRSSSSNHQCMRDLENPKSPEKHFFTAHLISFGLRVKNKFCEKLLDR
tara:strand:+ start:4003 stop:5199 length:1197 start_codon:yes stop_codon:yes gene_type:complete